MTQIVSQILTAAQKRIAYNRTIAEIESMPLDVALDLGIFREDAPLIAKKAVYGNDRFAAEYRFN